MGSMALTSTVIVLVPLLRSFVGLCPSRRNFIIIITTVTEMDRRYAERYGIKPGQFIEGVSDTAASLISLLS